jgi:C4-dicarboxylate transporter DctM subunit
MMIGLSLFGILFLLLLLGVPIAVSLGVASFISFAIFEPRLVLSVVPQRMFTGADNYVFMAVPFFLLSGELMLAGGISSRITDFVKSLFCRVPASLACVTTGASAFFGALSGSNPATVAAIGGVMVPNMVADGYMAKRAAAVAAASGTLGVIIPPSIPMVIYAVSGNVSVKSLFLGGVIPGVLLATVMILMHIILCGKQDRNLRTKFSFGRVWKTFRNAILALLMPVIILGGIYAAIFTPTEAAAVSVVYAFIIAKFVYKSLTWDGFRKLTIKAGISASIIVFVICSSAPFSWLLTSSGIPEVVAEIAVNVFQNKILILFMINILLLFLGMFLDTSAIIPMMTPLLLPIALQFGIDSVAFGIIMVVNTSIGMITPPLAANLFVACRISKVSLEEVSISILPYLAVEIAVVFVISYFPQIFMWVPMMVK